MPVREPLSVSRKRKLRSLTDDEKLLLVYADALIAENGRLEAPLDMCPEDVLAVAGPGHGAPQLGSARDPL